MSFSDEYDQDTVNVQPATCNPPSLKLRGAGLQLAALPCDHWHHYYHYQSSAQYLWLGVTLQLLGFEQEALTAYAKAVFQDHQNAEAIEGSKGSGVGDQGSAPLYNKHPLTDIAFCASVGQLPTEATRLHDEAVRAAQAGDYPKAIALLDKAVACDPAHSNSFFTRGKCWFAQKDYEKALMDFSEAVRLSHVHHEAYHRLASNEHLARGKEFAAAGELDLAIADFTKALDLFRKNKEALAEREVAQRRKGNS